MKRSTLWTIIGASAAALGIAALAQTTMPSGAPSVSNSPATVPPALATTPPGTQPSVPSAGMNNRYQNQGQYNQNGQGNFRVRNRNRRGNNGNFNANNGTTGPSDMAEIPPTEAMPIMYNVISARDIFVKGDQHTGVNGSGNQDIQRNDVRGPAPLVLDGASETDGVMVAYIEDTGTGEVRQFKVGDSVPQGKITRIDLGQIDLTANGKTTTILSRQTLTGDDAFGALYMSPALSSKAAIVLPTTLPSGDDIVARMQRRRMLEMQAATNPSIRPQ